MIVTKLWRCELRDGKLHVCCDGEINKRSYTIARNLPQYIWDQCFQNIMLESIVNGINREIAHLAARLDGAK